VYDNNNSKALNRRQITRECTYLLTPVKRFCYCDLDFMTLILDLDLDIPKTYVTAYQK